MTFEELLQIRGVTLSEVAETLKVNQRTVYTWLAGSRVPTLTIQQTKNLCTLLICSIHELPSDFKRAKSNTKARSK